MSKVVRLMLFDLSKFRLAKSILMLLGLTMWGLHMHLSVTEMANSLDNTVFFAYYSVCTFIAVFPY